MLEPLEEDIQRGLAALGLAPGVAVAERLAALVELLVKWNRVYNLTAVREPHAMVVRHILDSLAVLPFLTGGRLLDVGTGAGLPGLPIAIVRPDLSLTLLDSNAKKLRFVRQAGTELDLSNLDIVQQRIEQYRPAQAFDMVISRAVASIGDIYRDTAQLVRPGGRFLFMKGIRPDQEIAAFAPPGQLHVEALKVPGLDAERHLVWFEKQQDSGSMQL
ncbi:MAG: 16S rRNA (guanine(527)-N(7))-methyltransferase RsmG [Gammaproteobacteria bacterium]|nr:MAG: 16S rRNA (guanine(527)-N(7))-methyltransferase RsmG [Gammaproteobacteria bacterium]